MRSLGCVALVLLILVLGYSDDHVFRQPPPPPPPVPSSVIQRLIYSYEQKKATEYQGCFTGDFTYEFSAATDPTLVQQFSTGWFKNDEKEASSHLFAGY